jgi:hypothetical protein
MINYVRNSFWGFCTFACVFFATNASAESAYERMQLKIIGKATSVKVSVGDDVSDGCWPNPEATKSIIEEKLLSAGIPVKSSDAKIYFNFDAVGFALKVGARQTGCVASHSTK